MQAGRPMKMISNLPIIKGFLLAPAMLIICMSLYVSGGNGAEGGWHPVALKGEIRVKREIDFTTSFGGAELVKKSAFL